MDAFLGCKSLKYVGCPSSLKSIEEFAFEGCDNLETIIVPHGIKEIGFYAFIMIYLISLVFETQLFVFLLEETLTL